MLLSDEANLMTVLDIDARDPEQELRRFREALAATMADLAESKRQLAKGIPDNLAEIFTVYEMMLWGDDFPKEVEGRIKKGLAAASALRAVVSDYVARFEAMDDEYFRARSEDIRVLGSRVYGHLTASSPREIREEEKVVLRESERASVEFLAR